MLPRQGLTADIRARTNDKMVFIYSNEDVTVMTVTLSNASQ